MAHLNHLQRPDQGPEEAAEDSVQKRNPPLVFFKRFFVFVDNG